MTVSTAASVATWRGAPALAAVAMILAQSLYAWPFTIDDAYITARYAERILGGLGYTLNPGPPTDGVTGPLWLLPMLVAHALHLDVMSIAKGFGAVCALAAVAIACWQAAGGGLLAGWGTAGLLSVQSQLAVWGQAGLETGLTCLMLVLIMAASPRRVVARCLLVAAIPWLRPELLPAALIMAVLHNTGRADRASALGPCLGASVGLISITLFRLLHFGHIVPLSALAKPGLWSAGASYLTWGVGISTAGAGLVLAVFAARQRTALPLAAGCLLGWTAVLAAGGDWMPGYRLLVPLLPLYAWLAGLGAREVAARWGTSALASLFAMAVALPALDGYAQLPDVRAAGGVREATARALAQRLASQATRVALIDIGFLGYASGVEVIDLAGVTDPVIGRLPGGYLAKQLPISLLASREPDVILLHSKRPPAVAADGSLVWIDGYPVEQRIAASRWLKTHYRVQEVIRYAPYYHYVWLSRAAGP